MTCTIHRTPHKADLLGPRLRRARISAVFSGENRTDLEKILNCNIPARSPLPPHARGNGASPNDATPPASSTRRSAKFFDISEPVRLWIEGLAGLILLFAGLASVLVLTSGVVQ